MAKRNSTKTATKEALQASEPRYQVMKGWKGIHIKEAPINWSTEDELTNESHIPINYLMVQNNVLLANSGTLETRRETKPICQAPTGKKFTGVSCLQDKYLFCAFDDGTIGRWDTTNVSQGWQYVPINGSTNPNPDIVWKNISFGGVSGNMNMICLAEKYIDNVPYGTIFKGISPKSGQGIGLVGIEQAIKLSRPTYAPTITPMGKANDPEKTASGIFVFTFSYTNDFGNTQPSTQSATQQVTMAPEEFDSTNFLKISGTVPSSESSNWDDGVCLVGGVDIYFTLNNAAYPVYAGHAEVHKSDGSWSYNYYGALNDTSEWTSQNTAFPDQNTTGGVEARFLSLIDGRYYFYGSLEHPERLYIGGSAPKELSIARGLGGAFVDIEPGTGLEIRAVHKFKTQSGASIVTILCSNTNSGKTKRFNLIETNITVSSTLSEASFMVEEVANVVGCCSYYGSGVWADGMYQLDRYGLMITTQQMEYSSQVRSVTVSDAIQTIFTDRIAEQLDNARMIYIDDIIYIILAEGGSSAQLDKIIFCYDIGLKAWYTFSYDLDDNNPIHVFSLDYRGAEEGIGIITEDKVCFIPTTGEWNESLSTNYETYLETGECASTTPPTQWTYLCQLEFNFDWFIGDATIEIEGIDYFGRHIKVVKEISEETIKNRTQVFIRVDQKVRSYHWTIKGTCHYRLVDVVAKVYALSKKVGLVYGFDDSISYLNRHGATQYEHRTISSYNNLKEVLLP